MWVGAGGRGSEKKKTKKKTKKKKKKKLDLHTKRKKRKWETTKENANTKNKRKEMAEPGERPSITWGILLGCYALLFAALGVVLSRFFDVAYARAIGASMLLATGILAAPLVRLHGAVTV